VSQPFKQVTPPPRRNGGVAKQLLIVEDDRELREALADLLRGSGYLVSACADGSAALEALATQTFDLAIIDLVLPDMNGLGLLRAVHKSRPRLPILVVTGLADLESRVAGLDSGADDYVVKPFAMPELEARIRALLRKHTDISTAGVHIGRLRLVAGQPRIWLDGQAVDLSPREFELLEVLANRPGRPVSKTAIGHRLSRSRGTGTLSDTAIELCVLRLRRRLAPYGLQIRTLRGFGYSLTTPATAGVTGPRP
jgi:two-component system, OmpR family, response regulator